MADVSLTALIISNSLTFAAGALPVVANWIQKAGNDRRARADRRLRLAQDKRGQCVTLIRLARNFRVLVENARDARNQREVTESAKQIRQFVADVTGQADEVGFMVPAAETTATLLANEAAKLAALVTDTANRVSGELLRKPDFANFDRCLVEFREAARNALNDPAAIALDSSDKPATSRP